MKRQVEDNLLQWKDSSRRKPLILRGARQVGKTWLAEHFLAGYFEKTVKIDLEKRRDLHAVFDNNLDPRNILNLLELATEKIIPGETLLFLDEIQACPRAIMALRYFFEEMPELHVVAAGSLLEFAFDQISIPVGRVQYLHVHPMTFREYLVATGKEAMADWIEKHPAPATATTAHEQILKELRNYFFVGGMPECVKVWRDTASMQTVGEVQTEIIASYRDDFAKYTPKVNPSCLDAVLISVAKDVGEQLKYTRLDGSHSGPTNHRAFELLAKARIIHRIPAANPSGLPLGASANPKKFKASFLDIGLMQRICQLPVHEELRQPDLLAIYHGKMAEQFVAQEMAAAGVELYYWSREKRGSNAEVDFLVTHGGKIYPVEVKAGTSGSLRSLHLMLRAYPNCPVGIVLSSRPYAMLREQNLIFAPLYHAGLISRNLEAWTEGEGRRG